MHYRSLHGLLLRAVLPLLAALVITLAVFVRLPWLAVGCMTLLFVEAISVSRRQRVDWGSVALIWGTTLGAWGSVAFPANPVFQFDLFFAVLTGGIAAALLFSGRRLSESGFRLHWRLVGMVWAFMTAAIWLGTAYVMNVRWQFFTGAGFTVGLLIATKHLFRLPALTVQAVNTLIVILVGLPVADSFVRPSYRLEKRPDLRKRLYSYEEARKNPTAFEHWWYYFEREWRITQQSICMPATNSMALFRLRPGTEGSTFESRIHINKLGFRGPEIPAEKGDAYRIVALGESTTFGHTMYANDRSWPRVLEQLIRTNLHHQRRIEVINAGVPTYTLVINLERLHRRILALKPDMIISYHGYNGFPWLMPALPSVVGKSPPRYENRPLKLLADAEYRLKVIEYRHRYATLNGQVTTAAIDPMATEYARGYRELINLARTNHIKLVLANYSMAVNARSDLDVIAFYRAVFPQVLEQIRANEMHTWIVKTLTQQNDDVVFVDTNPWLDGEYEYFIDLVHFTQSGRDRIAEAIFEGIRPELRDYLGPPNG